MGFSCTIGNAQAKKELAVELRKAAENAVLVGLWFNGRPADAQLLQIAAYLEQERHHDSKSTEDTV
jgi:hypothetical protein